MGTHGISSDDLKSILTHLSEHGYAVIEGVLSERGGPALPGACGGTF